MNATRSALAVLVLMPSWASAEAFDWSAQLQKSPAALQAALGPDADCKPRVHSVPVKFVNQNTIIRAALFDPVGNTGSTLHSWTVGGEQDLSIDWDDSRNYVAEEIGVMVCKIGREATASVYSFDDKLFRIHLTFDRCGSREETTSEALSTPEKPFIFLACNGFDGAEKDFDTTLFKSIEGRNTYGYTKQGQPGMLDFAWNRFVSGEYEEAERDAVAGLFCSNDRPDGQVIFERENFRCLIDVDNADLSHWSSAAMYEFFTPGLVYNSVTKRLTAERVFIDMPSERQASASMGPGLQAIVDGIKKQISERIAAKRSKEGAVSNILGAP